MTETPADIPPGGPGVRTSFDAVVRLFRPRQWTKNLLVFAAVLFAGQVNRFDPMAHAVAAFVAMCLASSATYVLNDIADRDKDRNHPRKKGRPIASGEVSVTLGIGLAVVLLVLAATVSLAVNPWVFGMIAGYLALQFVYNAWLKSVPVADVFVIATGFVLRAVIGAQAVSVSVSGWLLFCTGALSLMLGFAKRREEFISQADEGGLTRASLVHYNRASLDVMVGLWAGIATMSYWIYCLGSPTGKQHPGLMITAPFVTYGVSRYLLLVFVNDEGGEPADILLKDKHIIVCVFGFVLAALVALSGNRIPIID